MTKWTRVLVATVLAMASGTSGAATARARAATPEVLILSGSRTAWVEVSLRAPITFDLNAMSTNSSGRYAGFYVDAVTSAQRQASAGNIGAVVPQDLRAPGAKESYHMLIWNRSKDSQTLVPGRYRFYLLADSPSTVRVPLKDGHGMSLRPTHSTSAALVADRDILVNPLQADNVRLLNVTGTRTVNVSYIVIGKFHAFAGNLGTCFRKPEAKCGTATHGGADGPYTGTVVDPLNETDFGFTTVYAPGALPPGRYEAWQGALNAAGGLKYATGAALSLTLA